MFCYSPFHWSSTLLEFIWSPSSSSTGDIIIEHVVQQEMLKQTYMVYVVITTVEKWHIGHKYTSTHVWHGGKPHGKPFYFQIKFCGGSLLTDVYYNRWVIILYRTARHELAGNTLICIPSPDYVFTVLVDLFIINFVVPCQQYSTLQQQEFIGINFTCTQFPPHTAQSHLTMICKLLLLLLPCFCQWWHSPWWNVWASHPYWLSGAPPVTVIVTIASFPGLNKERGTLYSFPTSVGPLVLIIDFFAHELWCC